MRAKSFGPPGSGEMISRQALVATESTSSVLPARYKLPSPAAANSSLRRADSFEESSRSSVARVGFVAIAVHPYFYNRRCLSCEEIPTGAIGPDVLTGRFRPAHRCEFELRRLHE